MKQWRTKPFPLYDGILRLIEGRHATGQGVVQVVPKYADDDENEGLSSEGENPGSEGVEDPSSLVCIVIPDYSCGIHITI